MAVSVLHIAPHYGGGVGTVVRSLIEEHKDRQFDHQLLAFESINDVMLDWCQRNKVTFFQKALEDKDRLNQWLAAADIVHLHWWNHPLLMDWIVDDKKPAFRSLLWAHVNGMHVPQIFFKELFYYPDLFVFASEYSFQTPFMPDNVDKIHLVQSRSIVQIAEKKQRKNNQHFNVGYIGTVDFVKLHSKFVRLCLMADIEQAKFIVCGGPKEAVLRQQVKELGVESKFDIRGVVSDVNPVLADLDVLGYPLNPEHYGTGEQVLLEAMGAGVVPVVLDTGCEKFIIDHGKNGIIASTLNEYSAALNYLSQNPEQLQRLSMGAQEKMRRVQAQHSEDAWLGLYQKLLNMEKRPHKLFMSQELQELSKGAGQLLQSYGLARISNMLCDLVDHSKELKMLDFPLGVFSATRGSPYHYLKFSPQDPLLQRICERLDAITSYSVDR